MHAPRSPSSSSSSRFGVRGRHRFRRFIATLPQELVAITASAAVPFMIAHRVTLPERRSSMVLAADTRQHTFDAIARANSCIDDCLCGFLAAEFQARVPPSTDSAPGCRRICYASWSFLCGLGASQAWPKDAIVHFRNVITPVACLLVAVNAASLSRDISRLIPFLTASPLSKAMRATFSMDSSDSSMVTSTSSANLWAPGSRPGWRKALRETGFRCCADCQT